MMMRDRRSRDRAKDETEALQTDVMRFLAIICMCLMIIFALVQSLPGPDSPSKKVSMSLMDAEQKVQEAERKVQNMTEAAKDLDQQIKEKQKALARMEKKREKADQNRTVQELEKKELEKKEQKAVPAQPEEKIAKMQKIEEAAETKKQVEENMTEKKEQAEKREIRQPKKQPPAKEEKKGFSLAFSSNDAFTHLLSKSHKTDLYLFARDNCWKLSEESRGRYKFHLSHPPDRVYDMQAATVPSAIERAAGKIRSVYGSGNVTYGVSLPSGIQQKIKSMMAQFDGGAIVIDRNGHIRMKETEK